MKRSISSYSFSKLFKDGFTLFDAMDKTASLGLDGFEIAGFDTPEGIKPTDFAVTLREYAEKKNLAIPSYTIAGNMLADDQPAEIARLCGEVDIAKILGAPFMRHDVGWAIPEWHKGIPTFDALLPIMAEGARKVTEYAATQGVMTGSENHGQFAQDADRVVRLVEAVNNTNYGVLADMGNFTCADDIPAVAFGKVLPVAKHVHVKDMFVKSGMLPNPGKGWFTSRAGNYIRCTVLGHGDVPVMQCLNQLKKSGYSGFVSLEFEGIENVIEAIEISIENLDRFIAILEH